MIITISGGVGSGKTISAVRQACLEAKNNMVLTNFTIKKLKNHYRLKQGDVLTPIQDGKKQDYEVNWDFWEQHKSCDIFLDEIQNLISSRNSMSKKSQRYSEFISQIRKLWGQSGDQNYLEALRRMNNNTFNALYQKLYSASNNIYLITQKPRKMDVNFRELCHVHIQCHKMKKGKDVFIMQDHYLGNDQVSGIEMLEEGAKPKKSIFHANPYFNRYDSYEIVRGEYL